MVWGWVFLMAASLELSFPTVCCHIATMGYNGFMCDYRYTYLSYLLFYPKSFVLYKPVLLLNHEVGVSWFSKNEHFVKLSSTAFTSRNSRWDAHHFHGQAEWVLSKVPRVKVWPFSWPQCEQLLNPPLAGLMISSGIIYTTVAWKWPGRGKSKNGESLS